MELTAFFNGVPFSEITSPKSIQEEIALDTSRVMIDYLGKNLSREELSSVEIYFWAKDDDFSYELKGEKQLVENCLAILEEA